MAPSHYGPYPYFLAQANKILLVQVVCWCNFYLKNCARKM